MFAKILLGLIVVIVALGFLAEWYHRWIRRVQPVGNSDPFAVPDLDEFARGGGPDTPKRAKSFLSTVHPDLQIRDPFFESTLKILEDQKFCLDDGTLELVARQQFPSPRIADHAYHCEYCRSKVLMLRRRGPR